MARKTPLPITNGDATMLVALWVGSIFVAVFVSGHVSLERGRIDIASGQVTATLETKLDGTTRWVFGEGDE